MKCLSLLLQALVCSMSLTHGTYPEYPFPASLQLWSVVPDLTNADRVNLIRGRVHEAIAWGSVSGDAAQTGTLFLDVHSNATLSGKQQAFAAGYLEGSLTSDVMWQYFNNVWSIDFNHSHQIPHAPAAVADFVTKNLAWMARNVEEHKNSEDEDLVVYWQHTGYLLNQLDGLTAGFNAHLPKGARHLSREQVMLITLIDGDMDDIVQSLSSTPEKQKHPTHCSAMIKLSPDGRELWTAHTNWDDYRAMLRVIKHFDLPLPKAVATRVSFDSYPGGLSSMTDFYRTSAGLTVTETSLDIENNDLRKLTTPKSMLTWARAVLANRLAGNGDTWTTVNLRHQSGTCNNQWMVVDYKLFTPGQPVPAGTLWVSETMPGFAERSDMSGALNGPSGSWFSYNIPYFANISKEGGYVQPSNPKASFLHCPRAQMYRREVENPTIKDLKTFVAFMRYNNRTDPLADGDACNGISARCDLNPRPSFKFHCFGAIDIKIATSSLFDQSTQSSLAFHATMSPSWNDIDNAPFEWSKQGRGCKQYGHVGQPGRFNFTMYTYPDALHPQDQELSILV